MTHVTQLYVILGPIEAAGEKITHEFELEWGSAHCCGIPVSVELWLRKRDKKPVKKCGTITHCLWKARLERLVLSLRRKYSCALTLQHSPC